MSKTETTKPEKSPRTRRPTVPISGTAHAEMQMVSEAFSVPFRVVRQHAKEVASEAILNSLRQRLGADKLAAAKAELARLEREMDGGTKDPQPQPEVGKLT